MKKIFLFLFITALAITACNEKRNNENTADKEESLALENTGSFLGEEFESDDEINLTELVSLVRSSDSVTAVVEAKVTEVCQAKGCWMQVQLPDGKSMRVTFKDYGFFMPKDLAGESIKMSGMAKIEETDIETLKHYAKDAGKKEEEISSITEAQSSYVFIASGVKTLDR